MRRGSSLPTKPHREFALGTDNMISWNWPNWITVVLMVALGYLVVSLAAQLVRGRKGAKSPMTGAGAGPSQSQDNFAGVYGASMFAMPMA